MTCEECDGTGIITVGTMGTWDREPTYERECPDCGGTGQQDEEEALK